MFPRSVQQSEIKFSDGCRRASRAHAASITLRWRIRFGNLCRADKFYQASVASGGRARAPTHARKSHRGGAGAPVMAFHPRGAIREVASRRNDRSAPRMREIARRRQALLESFKILNFPGETIISLANLSGQWNGTRRVIKAQTVARVITVVTGSIRLKNSPRLAVIVSRSLGFLFLGLPFCLGGGTTAAAPLK